MSFSGCCEPNLGDKCWLLQQKEPSPLLLQCLSRELPSISVNRVQHGSCSLSNVYLINLPKNHSALTLFSTVWLAFMAFYNAPCYKYSVQRWQRFRDTRANLLSSLSLITTKNALKNSPPQQRHTLWRLFWQKDTTKQLEITMYFHCKSHFQFRTTLLLFYLQFWQNLPSQLPHITM